MICLLAGLFISPAAGDNASDELNNYYYSGTGNNICNIMYTEIDWQDCTSVKLFYSTKYDIGPGDHAHFFWSDDMKLLYSWPSLEYSGNKQDWSLELPVDLTEKIGKKYIGFIYITDDSEYGEGFCVDNIQMLRTDTYTNLIFDDAESELVSDMWISNFTIESENVSSDTTLLEITHPPDIAIKKGDIKTITWTITVIPENENKYWIYKNDTKNIIQTPTDYQSGEEVRVSIDTTAQGEWDYIICVNDTSGKTINDQVGVKIFESMPLSINITSHDIEETLDTSPITVMGCVVTELNSTPTVTVNGVTANVQGENSLWDYSVSVPLVSGNNIINATATISNDTKSYSITVIKKDEILIDNSNDERSTSGGSSSGGGTSGEAFHNIDIKEIERESVSKNNKVSYSFNSEGNIIRYINFTGLTNSGTVAAKVEILKNTSTLVDTVPPDYIYENLNIWLGNKGWATSQNMDDPIIEFYVEKSWVTENDIDESTIVMNRYNSGSWEELTTTLTTRDADKLYFTSNTAGFASFAVTGKQLVADEAGGEGMEEQTIEATPEHTTTQSQEDIPGFCLLFSLIVFFITINYRKK